MTLSSTMQSDGLLSLRNVFKHFDISGGLLDQLRFRNGRLGRERTTVKAVNNVSFTINAGETFSVVGESGCGKSTLARTTIGIYPPNSGEIHYRDQRIDNRSSRQMLPFRRKMQMIFQDPYASLNPRKTVRQTLEEPVLFHNPTISTSQARNGWPRSWPRWAWIPNGPAGTPMSFQAASVSGSVSPAH